LFLINIRPNVSFSYHLQSKKKKKKKKKKNRRRRENLCLYCCSVKHSLENCPLKNRNKASTSSSHITNPYPKLNLRPRILDEPNIKFPIFEFFFSLFPISLQKQKFFWILFSKLLLNLMDIVFPKENNIYYLLYEN